VTAGTLVSTCDETSFIEPWSHLVGGYAIFTVAALRTR
jgi:hypothetical protein